MGYLASDPRDGNRIIATASGGVAGRRRSEIIGCMHADETLQLADRMLANWDGLLSRQSAFTSRKGVTPARLVMAFGLASQAYDVGRDALAAIRAGRNGAAMPLVRIVFECAVHAQWLVAEPDAADAMFAETRRQHIALADNMARTQRFLQHAATVRAGAGTAPATPPAVSARRFEQICEQIDPAGDVYVMFRMLSADAHAGVPVVERWFAEIPVPPGLAWRIEPADQTDSVRRDTLAGTLALSLLWAGAGLDAMLRTRPLVKQLNAVGAKLGYRGVIGVGRLVLPPRDRS
jgi:hypothetical protein